MSKNSDLIDDFIRAWAARDLELIMGFFADDAVYHNIPMEPATGIDAIRSAISGFIGMAGGIEFVVHHSAETRDGIVLNERTDRFKVGDDWAEAPVMGIFEIRNGKISAWRDYFDLAQFTSQMPSGE